MSWTPRDTGDILQLVGGLALQILFHPHNSDQLMYFKAAVRQQQQMGENVFINNICVLSGLTQRIYIHSLHNVTVTTDGGSR